MNRLSSSRVQHDIAAAADQLAAITEARDVFRCAVGELLARAKNAGISGESRERAKLTAEDLLSDLFYGAEQELEAGVERDERVLAGVGR